MAILARLASDWLFASGGPLAYQALQAALLAAALLVLWPNLDLVFLRGGDVRRSLRLGSIALPIALLGGLAFAGAGSHSIALPTAGQAAAVVASNAFFCAVEELEFRGFLLSWLIGRGMRPMNAIWLQALVFVAAHPHWLLGGRWSMLGLALLLGWWLGTIVVRTRSLYGAYLTHFGSNVLLFLPQIGSGTYVR